MAEPLPLPRPPPPPNNHFPSKHPQNVLFSTQTLHFLPDHPQTPPLSTQTHRPPPHLSPFQNGDGFVDTNAKLQRIVAAIQAALP